VIALSLAWAAAAMTGSARRARDSDESGVWGRAQVSRVLMPRR
jgi:hypothetical protein